MHSDPKLGHHTEEVVKLSVKNTAMRNG